MCLNQCSLEIKSEINRNAQADIRCIDLEKETHLIDQGTAHRKMKKGEIQSKLAKRKMQTHLAAIAWVVQHHHR
jgi:hypothetical protein